MMNRRNFLTGCIATFTAPMIVPYSSLMPIRAIAPPTIVLLGDLVDRAFGTFCLYSGAGVLLAQTDVDIQPGLNYVSAPPPFLVAHSGIIERAEVDYLGRKWPIDLRLDTRYLTTGNTIKVLDMGWKA